MSRSKDTDIQKELNQTLDGLKDFQQETVEFLYHRMYRENSLRMLVADEVGLGKTIVARGLLARIVQARMESKEAPLRVVYICSNLVIAKENLAKLYPLPKSESIWETPSRLGYLGYEFYAERSSEQPPIQISALTPGTSFHVTWGIGDRRERAAIYGALWHDPSLQKYETGLQWLVRGGIDKFDQYKVELSKVTNASEPWHTLRPGFAEEFIQQVKAAPSPSGGSLYHEVVGLVRRLTGESAWKSHSTECEATNGRLRRCLVDTCKRYLKADIYILDEFQRFRELVHPDPQTEEAQLAKTVFEQTDDSRILLLSATPYKPFTGIADQLTGEDHYKDFRQLLKFLFADEPEYLAEYDQYRGRLYRQLLDLKPGEATSAETRNRDAVTRILQKVMCRTERTSVSVDATALIADTWKDVSTRIDVTKQDIKTFRASDRLAQALDECQKTLRVPAPVEYCKSAPMPLSFMEHYKFKTALKDSMLALDYELSDSGPAWLDLDAVHSYRFRPSESHGKLNRLINDSVGEKGATLLWVPPSLPYYPLEGAFAGSEGFSKTLLFSSWVMVPRMVSTLISYEVERQTIVEGDGIAPSELEATKTGEREYFTGTDQKRLPTPLLKYSRTNKGKAPANMTNLTLLYPSLVLSELSNPALNVRTGRSLVELKRKITEAIADLLEPLVAYEQTGGEQDRWYWAAPLLLDLLDESTRQTTTDWLNRRGVHGAGLDGDSESERGDESGAEAEHWRLFRQCFEAPQSAGLGKMPEDLPEVLADLSLGSPAVLALRSFRRCFPEHNSDLDHMLHAGTVAQAFQTLFNKPEPIDTIRKAQQEPYRGYWHAAIRYCATGCLQSVLDEYLHLSKEQLNSLQSAARRLVDTVNLQVTTIQVDSLKSFRNEENQRRMRCHYAVEFGSQRLKTEDGNRRATNLREVFNSPFRPFVLATTSIGQEGLDFHHYCRKVVHWNLPSNPIDFEQREGRVNRFKGLVIRQRIARRYGKGLEEHQVHPRNDVWKELFAIAAVGESQRASGKISDPIPFWHIDGDTDAPMIERIIPIYPYSRDWQRLDQLLQTLSIYRLAFGQPRQSELINHLLSRNLTQYDISAALDRLVINLSPMALRNKSDAFAH
jgi:hypothetical protein